MLSCTTTQWIKYYFQCFIGKSSITAIISNDNTLKYAKTFKDLEDAIKGGGIVMKGDGDRGNAGGGGGRDRDNGGGGGGSKKKEDVAAKKKDNKNETEVGDKDMEIV